jgi:putative ABC transport system substrate-binding protein
VKETVTGLSRLGVLGDLTNRDSVRSLEETEFASRTLGVKHHFAELRKPEQIESAFGQLKKHRVDAVLVLPGTLNSHRNEIIRHAVSSRLPVSYYAPEWAEDGGSMTYGVSFPDLYRRAATYVDKILKGTKPADLPVEQPRKFELVLNLKAAKQIGPDDSAKCAGASGQSGQVSKTITLASPLYFPSSAPSRVTA